MAVDPLQAAGKHLLVPFRQCRPAGQFRLRKSRRPNPFNDCPRKTDEKARLRAVSTMTCRRRESAGRTVVPSISHHEAASQELRSRAMSIQFAGSKSADDRRRRRLVVNADDSGADGTTDEGLPGSGVSSELVESAAAAPWVPVYEWRLWTYATLIGLVISGAAFALATPMLFRPELAPLTKHLLEGDRPALAVLIQTIFCFLCAQLSLLIGWYRAQCKLDFRGLYRVWPWAAAVFGTAAICLATNTHTLLGQIVESSHLLQWRPSVVAWLLPLTIAASPLVVLIDRDVRRSRSSLYTLRAAWMLSLASASLELCAIDLTDQPWAAKARIIVPLFAAGTLFVGLWLHARIVAYICPDPPESTETSAVSQLMAAFSWVAARLVWKRAPRVVEPEAKPKRGRKKATADDEDEAAAAPKRKRKTPAKRVTKPRTRKVTEVEEEEVEEDEQESTYSDEAADGTDSSYGYEEESEESNEWQEEEEEEPTPPPKSANRSNRESSPVPPPYSGAQKFANNSNTSKSNWKEPEPASNDSDDDNDDDSDDSESGDSSGGPDPLKGLSKRQKRELRRQNKERNQRR
jgi:hypothetical protein